MTQAEHFRNAPFLDSITDINIRSSIHQLEHSSDICTGKHLQTTMFDKASAFLIYSRSYDMLNGYVSKDPKTTVKFRNFSHNKSTSLQ